MAAGGTIQSVSTRLTVRRDPNFVHSACRTVSPYPRKLTVLLRSTAAVANIRCDCGPKKEEAGTKAFPPFVARFHFRNYADSLYEIGMVNTPLTEGLNFH